MALSNKFGWLVLTTGNKSEMAIGYATLYGDMAGGFAVIKDVPKTLVYALARYRNARAGRDDHPASRDRRSRRRPSCGRTSSTRTRCRPTTCSTRSSRPTSRTTAAWTRSSRWASTRRWCAASSRMVDRNEYKRRQAPPGVKITPRAFGRDRRLPIANRYRER